MKWWIWLVALAVGCSGSIPDDGVVIGAAGGTVVSIDPQEWWFIGGEHLYSEDGTVPAQEYLEVDNEVPSNDYETPKRWRVEFFEAIAEEGEPLTGAIVSFDYHYGVNKDGVWKSNNEQGTGLQILASELVVGELIGQPWLGEVFRFAAIEECDGEGGACLRLDIESDEPVVISSFLLQRNLLPPAEVVIDTNSDGFFRTWRYEGRNE